MKTVDHSYEQALIMHDNVHIHVIMNIIVTPMCWSMKTCIHLQRTSESINCFVCLLRTLGGLYELPWFALSCIHRNWCGPVVWAE